MAKVAFIGLGVMGYPMAGHLLKKGGHELTVYNRNAAKAAAWVKEYGAGKTAATPAEAAKDQDFVFSCVGNDDDLRSVTLGKDGAFEGMRKGATFIDNTTVSANIARELYAAAKAKGFGFLDAPVSGGSAGATNGVLTVMVGGDADTFAESEPVIAAYARMVTLIGAPGAGQLTKMVNQICIAGAVQGLAEGIHFAQRAGLDISKVMETTGCARTSRFRSMKLARTARRCLSQRSSISSTPRSSGSAASAGILRVCSRASISRIERALHPPSLFLPPCGGG
jgi:3-hydroxyisobutyrate dehydrogenase